VLDGIPTDGPWFRAEGGSDDAPRMIRARQDILGLLPAPSLSTRVVVTWACRDPLNVGLPSASDYDEIKDFEDSLVSFVQEGAVLAFVFTASGLVAYTFYTSDSDWFVERLNEAMSHKAALPIELAGEDDPDWAEYRSIMKAVGLDPAA
jgi:hypothetical protein